MKLEALRHQGQRSDLTPLQFAAKFHSDDEVAKRAGVSSDTVRRYRLTELDPLLQQKVDAGWMIQPAMFMDFVCYST